MIRIILVYAYDAGETSKRDRAIQVLDEVFEIGRGALTTQVLSEFFVTVTRKLAPPLSVDEAERSVRNYIAHGPYSMSPRAMSRSRFGVCDGTDSRTGIASFGRSHGTAASLMCYPRTSRPGAGLRASSGS